MLANARARDRGCKVLRCLHSDQDRIGRSSGGEREEINKHRGGTRGNASLLCTSSPHAPRAPPHPASRFDWLAWLDFCGTGTIQASLLRTKTYKTYSFQTVFMRHRHLVRLRTYKRYHLAKCCSFLPHSVAYPTKMRRPRMDDMLEGFLPTSKQYFQGRGNHLSRFVLEVVKKI